MKTQQKSNVFNFFENTDNYNEALRICHKLLPYENSKETLHDIYIKLETSEHPEAFPKKHESAIFFLIVVIQNHKTDRERKKLPIEVDLSYAFDFTEDASPEIIQKLDALNDLILKEKELFTEEQMKLWNYMYECYPVDVIAKAMRRKLGVVYSLTAKMRSKIRKSFKRQQLYE